LEGWKSVDIVQIILEVLVLFLGGLWIKNFFPAYMGKKGENLATKEDIQTITRLTENVQDEFKRSFEEFSKDKEFKYKYYYDQFRELYTKLYSIIAQSEYTRRFFKLYNGTDLTFEKVPFVEIHKTHKEETIQFGKDVGVTRTETEIKDGITNFCKGSLCDLIINKGELATQQLLKLAVAYRFAYDNYSGTAHNGDAVDTANEEEFKLIKEMLICIVKDYNFLRKELKLEYIESELTTGLFENIVLNDERS
jgi:hypothetical protein